MTDLEALAARVEAASGPDEQLDFDIAEAVGWAVSKVTASLNAAVKLIPKGWWIRELKERRDRSRCFVVLDANPNVPLSDGSGANPALALTAAALRAKAKEQP